MLSTLSSFDALCLQRGSCLSELAATLSPGLSLGSDNEQHISAAEGVGGDGRRLIIPSLSNKTKSLNCQGH